MELWIRSQDRDYLIKVKSLVIEESNYNIYQIFGDSRYLGKYKTKERALEVLDEIQALLKPKVLLNSGKILVSFEDTI